MIYIVVGITLNRIFSKECDLHMVKVIIGQKGSGKTKMLVDLIRQAAEESHGNVVCIEKDKNLTFDIPYSVRLIHAGEYSINSNALLRGFISGLHAGNYDITHVFIDNFLKMLDDSSVEDVAVFLDWLDKFSTANSVDFVVAFTADPSAPKDPRIKRFVINDED